MARVLIDTTVLFAAAYRRDARHDDALPILRGIDRGSLPEATVLDFVLAETLNGLSERAGHDAAVDFLDRIEENAHYEIDHLTADAFAAAKSLFRQYRGLSFVDACIVSFMLTQGVEYLYAFDDDFDAVDDVYRLDSVTNPFDPE